MITGRVNSDLEAVIGIAVQDDSGEFHRFQCVIDTGFNGFLAMPSDIIQELGLVFRQNRATHLVGSVDIYLPVYLGIVDWHEELLEVSVVGTEQDFLVGASMLENSILTVQVWDGGDVSIEPR